jgi:hypothetical protein
MSEPAIVEDHYQWSIVELLGRRRVAGLVSEVERFGTKMLRIDIPKPGDGFLMTQFYAGAALYCVTPTTEKTARAVAALGAREPATRWELPSRSDEPEDEIEAELGPCPNCGAAPPDPCTCSDEEL